jgi:hypothetical protein
MTDLGVLYSQLPTEVINTVNGIINDGLQQAQKILNPNYELSYRNVRPQDAICGAATFTWNNTYNASSTEKVCGTTAATVVPTRQAVLHFGWYSSADFGLASHFNIAINGKTRNEIDARTVWEQPGHVLITPDRVLFAKENDIINFNVVNGVAIGISANVAPLAVVYGEASVLGID